MIDSSEKPAATVAVAHPILGILLLIVLALLAAELVRHKRRLPSIFRILVYTYTEFVLLGLAIGPKGLNLVDSTLVGTAEPFLQLSLGGVGLIYGLQFRFAQMKRFSPHMFALAFFQAAVTFALCTAAFFPVLKLLGIRTAEALFLSAILATIASVSAPQIIAHTIHEQQARGENAHLLQFITALDGGFGILVLALLVGARSEYGLTPWGWLNAIGGVAFSALIGLVCGLAFHWLTVARATVEEMILYLLGLVTLSSGVAATLELSPLFVNILFGMTVANLSVRVEEVYGQTGRLERPLFIVLLILAGARWNVSFQWFIPLVGAYLVFRSLGKWAGCRLGGKLFPLYFKPVAGVGLGLMGQGGIALALLINVGLVEHMRRVPSIDPPLLAIIETVVIVAIMLNELAAPPMVRHVLARGGEWRSTP